MRRDFQRLFVLCAGIVAIFSIITVARVGFSMTKGDAVSLQADTSSQTTTLDESQVHSVLSLLSSYHVSPETVSQVNTILTSAPEQLAAAAAVTSGTISASSPTPNNVSITYSGFPNESYIAFFDLAGNRYDTPSKVWVSPGSGRFTATYPATLPSGTTTVKVFNTKKAGVLAETAPFKIPGGTITASDSTLTNVSVSYSSFPDNSYLAFISASGQRYDTPSKVWVSPGAGRFTVTYPAGLPPGITTLRVFSLNTGAILGNSNQFTVPSPYTQTISTSDPTPTNVTVTFGTFPSNSYIAFITAAGQRYDTPTKTWVSPGPGTFTVTYPSGLPIGTTTIRVYNLDSGAILANSAAFIVPQTSTPPPTSTSTITAASPTTSAVNHRGANGQSFSYQCPAGSNTGSVWGTDTYTDDSSVCAAAVHAGAIPPTGGLITITIAPGAAGYTGTLRNGVGSMSWGAWTGSFTVMTGSVPPPPPPPPATTTPPTSTTTPPTSGATQATAITTATNHRGANNSQFSYICPANAVTGSVWGTDIYTDDSAICAAAVHAGAATSAGGTVTIEIRPGQPSYVGTTRNTITSKVYSSWVGSYVFVQPQSNAGVFNLAGVIGAIGAGAHTVLEAYLSLFDF